MLAVAVIGDDCWWGLSIVPGLLKQSLKFMRLLLQYDELYCALGAYAVKVLIPVSIQLSQRLF